MAKALNITNASLEDTLLSVATELSCIRTVNDVVMAIIEEVQDVAGAHGARDQLHNLHNLVAINNRNLNQAAARVAAAI